MKRRRINTSQSSIERICGDETKLRIPFYEELKSEITYAENEVCLIPHYWTYYLWPRNRQIKECLLNYIRQNKNALFVIFYQGDMDLDLRKIAENVVLFASSIDYNNDLKNVFALPILLNQDPMEEIQKHKIILNKNPLRRIGWRGNSKISFGKLIYAYVRAVLLSIYRKDFRGPRKQNSTVFRAMVLSKLEKILPDSSLDLISRTFFYKKNMSGALKQRIEFLNCLNDNWFSLVIRGYGNWSYRFYETMAMGRIPLIVNPDHSKHTLPFQNSIDYTQSCMIIDNKKMNRSFLNEMLDLKESTIKEMGAKNRQIFLKYYRNNSSFIEAIKSEIDAYIRNVEIA